MVSELSYDIFYNPYILFSTLCGVSAFSFLSYAIYQLYFSSLSSYPGPWQCAITDIWFAKAMFLGDFHVKLHKLHQKHGDIVRIGPNRLSFISPDAVKKIYLSGSTWKKSSYYNGFTAVIPNAFGTQDENFHRIRRRQLSYAFSQSSVLSMEPYMDIQMRKYRTWLEKAVKTGETIDLRKLLHWLVIDVLGDLAFGQPFGVLDDGDDSKLPELEHHLRMGAVSGSVPWAIPYFRQYGAYLPFKWIHDAFACRNTLKGVATAAVDRAMRQETQRKDILGILVASNNPDTGKPLTRLELEAESFGFLIAGTHTTAVTLALMCDFLLRDENAACLEKLLKELDALPALTNSQDVYAYASIVDHVPYFAACLQETHRKGGVFNMPLYRVVPEGGAEIAGEGIPAGTEVSISNFCIHRNESIFDNPEAFKPERWLGKDSAELTSYLLPFSVGHRSCLGRNLATTEIYKALTTLFRHYKITRLGGQVLKTRSLGVMEVQDALNVKLARRA